MGTYITNIGLLATPRGHSARRGTQQGDVTLLRNAWVELCGETIAAVGQGTPAPAECELEKGQHEISVHSLNSRLRIDQIRLEKV